MNGNTLIRFSSPGLRPRVNNTGWESNCQLLRYLVTIKKASAITGSSQSFFQQLIREKKLNRYKINTATFVSLIEFEQLAIEGRR